MRGFREVGWVIAVAGTTLGCYMVNLRVASERAALDEVSNRIVLAQRDIRVLQTEIGTRGRLEQLESWNVRVLALSAPQAHQFLEGEFQLATLAAPQKQLDPSAPMVLAAAPAQPKAVVGGAEQGAEQEGRAARDLLQVASLKRELPASADEKAVDKAGQAGAKPVKAEAKPATPAAADKKIVPERKDKAAATPAGAAVAATKAKAKPKAASPTTSTKDSKARQ